MPTIDLQLDGDNCWPDLTRLRKAGALKDLMGNETSLSIAVLPGGTEGGEVSVTFRVNAPDGQVILFETTWYLLHAAVRTIEATYGKPR